MIIDEILDRKYGFNYDPQYFYDYVKSYNLEPYSSEICKAMDDGNNQAVQSVLCRYIIQEEYNSNICGYIQASMWV